jgi:hypothetical protein
VTLPFFATAAVLLGVFGHPRQPVSSPVVLIVTTETLRPAFMALETWNDERGCPTRVLTLTDRGAPAWLDGLAVSRRDLRGLLLGGDRAQVPGILEEGGLRPLRMGTWTASGPFTAREPRLLGVPVLRAPVRDLGEAWAFFEACRASGKTLDRLLAADAVSWEGARSLHGRPDLAAVARPR